MISLKSANNTPSITSVEVINLKLYGRAASSCLEESAYWVDVTRNRTCNSLSLKITCELRQDSRSETGGERRANERG
jgi:hypothetical protein